MKDLQIIEKILVEKGRVINYSELVKYFAEYKNVSNKISSLMEKGFLVNIKKGVYYISKLGSLGYTSISNYIIANTIGEISFVSFEGSLKYHGIFDQGLKKYRSIAKKQYLNKTLENITYEYIKVKDSSYFGHEWENVDGGKAKIATKERALLDLIEYKKSIYAISLVLEKLSDYKKEIDFKLLNKYLKNYSQVTIKTCGLLLDLIKQNSQNIEKLVNKNSASKISTLSNKFSNKWRLYYDSILEEQLI